MLSRLTLLIVIASTFALAGATCGARPVSELPKGEDPTHEALAVGDVVDVQVFNEPDLSGQHQIGAGGHVRLPLLGDVPAAGLTLDKLQANVQHAYNAKYLKNGVVSVKLVDSTTLTVYVLGQVAKPGPYPFRGHMTLLHAIALAGGTTKLADSQVELTRKDEHDQGVLVVVDFPAIRSGAKPDVDMQPGDVIYVPETPL